MQILIDSAPDGYSIEFHSDNGEKKVFPETISSMQEVFDYAFTLAAAIKKETGEHIEPLLSAAAIRDNRKRDIAARKAWNNPNFRVIK